MQQCVLFNINGMSALWLDFAFVRNSSDFLTYNDSTKIYTQQHILPISIQTHTHTVPVLNLYHEGFLKKNYNQWDVNPGAFLD